jgi:site-specific DNA recombinase
VGSRDGESFVSPTEQIERIRATAERDGLKLIETIEELDVSGGTALGKRPGLRRAVEMVEAGEAHVVVVAYFDELVRSLTVQAEVLERVEAAGGQVLAVDVGEVRADTAGRWLSSTMLGMVAEYARRSTSERTAEAKRRAVARGVPPFPRTPPGYRRLKDGTLEPDKNAAAVTEAFNLRAGGATIAEVRAYLAAHGIVRSFHGTQALLASRIPLGEIHFGKLVNENAHEAIVDASTWRRAQKMIVPRGRRPKSDRLLARTGVLRCGSCGGRMSIGTTKQGGRNYSFYRCSPIGDCIQRVTISADIAEALVVDAVKELLADVEGTASADSVIEAARAEVDRLESELDGAVRAFSGLDDVQAATEKLGQLRDDRDAARDRLDSLAANAHPAVTAAAEDWDELSLEGRRGLIQAVIDRAEVGPGRGAERVTVVPRH